MSLIDTIGPVILLTLLGLAVLLAVLAWIGLSLLPRVRLYRINTHKTQRILDYNREAQDLVASLVGDPTVRDSLPEHIQDQLWLLQGVDVNRKGLTK
jgi:hypothetical protein